MFISNQEKFIPIQFNLKFTFFELKCCYLVNAYLGKNFRVADDNDSVLSSGESNVETAGIVEETDALVFVGAHTRHDDQVLLSPLECVDTRHLYALVQLRRQSTLVLHELNL